MVRAVKDTSGFVYMTKNMDANFRHLTFTEYARYLTKKEMDGIGKMFANFDCALVNNL
jgi:hypothetical protein